MNPDQSSSGPTPQSEIQSPRIALDDIAIVCKDSKFHFDQRRFGLNAKELLKRYEANGVDPDHILKSHDAQLHYRHTLERIFSPEQFIERDLLTNDRISDATLVIALGGDNHFTFVSHFVADAQLLLGVNSDPTRSVGALLSTSADHFEETLRKLVLGEYSIQEWAQLEATLSDSRTIRATSELFIGETENELMSRHLLCLNNTCEEQKCSGLVVATPAGRTGWYDSASRYLFPDGDDAPWTNREFRFIVREPYRGKHSSYQFLQGSCRDHEKCTVRVLSDSVPVLSADSLRKIPLLQGEEITLGLRDTPLRVVDAAD